MKACKAFIALFFILWLGGCGEHRSAVPPVAMSKQQGSKPSKARVFSTLLNARHATDLGPAPASEKVHLLIQLAHRNQSVLDQLIKDQVTPGSPQYLHFLTPQEFDAQFGASIETRNRVKGALAAAGFSVNADRFGAASIEADGNIASAQSLFGISIHNVREDDGHVAHMPSDIPVTPAALQTDVVAILGLDTTNLVKKPYDSTTPSVVYCTVCPTPIPRGTPFPKPTVNPVPTPTPYPGSGPGQPLTPPLPGTDDTTYNSQFGYTPYTYAYDYDLPVQHGFGGSPQFPIGIIGEADVSDTDVSNFMSYMHIPRTGKLVRVGIPATAPGLQWQKEATLDVEAAASLAPGADVYLYLSQSMQAQDMTGNINTVVQQDIVAVLSISADFCENTGYPNNYESASGIDSAAAQASAEGITVVASSGDSGGPKYLSGCDSVMAPAASSYIVAVGGTSPDAPNNNQGAAGSYGYRVGHEYAWGEPAPTDFIPPCSTQGFCGTGGGASTHFQTSEQIGACGPSGTTWRCVPDISFAADIYHEGALVFNGSLYAGSNGTSFATPIFAAMQAEIDQRQNARHGNILPRLYSAWSTYSYASYMGGPAIFRDMTSGNSGYGTGVGWDAASGLGSVDGWALSAVE